MFDVTKAREIFYGEDQSVIVFGDHEADNTWYMVPVPQLRTVGSEPAFSLTRYRDASGDVAGVCTFEVELVYPAAARAAAESELGPDIVWGQFTWTGGDVFFRYDIEGETDGIIVSPSLFGSNVATFQIELDSDAAVTSFINAFSRDGSVSPFEIEYEMTALTNLLGARATVTYNADAAIAYEKTYEKRKDTWGNTKNVLVEVKQVLKRSGAGDVVVEKGAGGSDETVQRVRDWAWSTLEQEVAANIETARQMATGPFPVSASTSFTHSYEENAIVDWTTPVSGYLPKFNAETWNKVYSEVDNRELVVTFALAGQLFDENNEPAFENVLITVDYPTRSEDNTFRLVAGSDDMTANTYVAKGALDPSGKFDPNYRYKYVINYADGGAYTSEWIDSSETRVELRPSDFGMNYVRFIGSNIPFATDGSDPEKSVKSVFIDFFFKPPEGKDALVKSQEMTANGQEGQVEFVSHYHQPIGQSYSYRLRYLMGNDKVITIEPDERYGGDNAEIVQVLSPLEAILIFNLRAVNVDDRASYAFELIEINASYYDTPDGSGLPAASHDWSWVPDKSVGVDTAEPWSFQATPNSDTSYFRMGGQIIFGDGTDFVLDQYYQPADRRSLILYSDSEIYSVKIDPRQIAWDTISAVYLNLFQVSADAPDPRQLGHIMREPLQRLTTAQQAEIEGKRVNYQRFQLLGTGTEAAADSAERYYNIRRLRSDEEITFYYDVEYVMKDGTTHSLDDQVVNNKLQLVLPPVAGGGEAPEILEARIPAAKLRPERKPRSLEPAQ